MYWRIRLKQETIERQRRRLNLSLLAFSRPTYHFSLVYLRFAWLGRW
jgi:hypothetical protein